MRLSIQKTAINKPILGYIHQAGYTYPEVKATSVASSIVLHDSQYIYPSNDRIAIAEDPSDSGIHTFFVAPNESYICIVNTTSGTLTVKEYKIGAAAASTIKTIEPIEGTQYGYFRITTSSLCRFIRLLITSIPGTIDSFRYWIIKGNLDYKLKSHSYMYRYRSKLPVYNNTTEYVKLMDDVGNIYGSQFYDLTIEDGHVVIESDIIKTTQLFLVYDTNTHNSGDGIMNYKEAIDPIAISNVEFGSVEYAIPKNNRPLFLLGDDSIPSQLMLCTRNTVYLNNDGDMTKAYGIAYEPTFTKNTAGDLILDHSKIIKEQPIILDPNTIKTQHPIRPRYILDYNEYDIPVLVPHQVMDLTDGINVFGGEEGVTIFQNGTPINNRQIEYIQEDEGIIKLGIPLTSSDIRVTYTTDPFTIHGTLGDLGIDTTTTFYALKSSEYQMIIPTVREAVYINTLGETVEHNTDGRVYTNDSIDITDTGYIYIPNLFAGDTYTILIGMEDRAHIELQAHTGDGNWTIVGASVNTTAGTTVTYPSITGVLDTSIVAYRVLISNTGIGVYTPVLHDLSVYSQSTSGGGVYYSTGILTDGATLTNLETGATITYDGSQDLYTIGSIHIINPDDQIYTYIESNVRGGGLIDDKEIRNKLGYDRSIIFPESVEYGDIASRNNRPLNPTKFIIIKLPLSIITTLINDRAILNEGLSYLDLREWAIRTVYQRIRESLNSGSYFKIYDENNNPWPLEFDI